MLFDLQIFSGSVYHPSATSRTISFSISNIFFCINIIIKNEKKLHTCLPALCAPTEHGAITELKVSNGRQTKKKCETKAVGEDGKGVSQFHLYRLFVLLEFFLQQFSTSWLIEKRRMGVVPSRPPASKHTQTRACTHTHPASALSRLRCDTETLQCFQGSPRHLAQFALPKYHHDQSILVCQRRTPLAISQGS